MAGQLLLAHPLMGAEGDHHRDPGDPAGQRLVRGPQQQRQRAGPGAVRHHQADPLAVQIRPGQGGDDELGDLLGRQVGSDAADA